MRMLRWMSGHTRQDRIRNKFIREKVRVVPVVEKKWQNVILGCVRRSVEAPIRRVDWMEGSLIAKGKGRSRIIIGETIKTYLEVNGFSVDLILQQNIMASFNPNSQPHLVERCLAVIIITQCLMNLYAKCIAKLVVLPLLVAIVLN